MFTSATNMLRGSENDIDNLALDEEDDQDLNYCSSDDERYVSRKQREFDYFHLECF